MKILFLALTLAGGFLWSGCSKQSPFATEPRSPLEPMVTNGWKASWSPDGRQLIYGQGNGAELVRLDLATRQATRWLTAGKDAAWSPDGRAIAFVREESFNNYQTEEVWVADADGKNARRLVTGGFPSWSSDGKKLFVHSRQANQILAVNPENPLAPPEIFFSNTPAWYFSVAPDEKQIAFGCEGRLEIRDCASAQIVASWPTPREGGLLPAWSPDGKFVAFGGFDGSQLGLWVFDVTNSKAAKIADGHCTMPAWSLDGNWLAFDDRGAARMIWRIGQPDIELLLRNAQPARPPELIGQERTTDTLSLIGEPAPDFNLPSLDDTSVRLADFKGSVVVLDFWATWCPPCRKSLPHLQRLSRDAALQKKGLKVLAVNLKEPKDQVAEFQKQNGYNIPVALDGNGATAKKYLVQGIPTTVIIDAAGLIKGTFVGFGADSEKQLDAAINAVLGVR